MKKSKNKFLDIETMLAILTGTLALAALIGIGYYLIMGGR